MKNVLKKIVAYIITLEARAVLKKHNPKIVAITGSVGKTSTKDAVFAVLSSTFYTRKSEKSFNSEIGIPLTILGLPNGWNNPFIWLKNIIKGLMTVLLPEHYPKWLVLEVGADRPNDIGKICRWLKPDSVVVTRFGNIPVHVEFFPSIESLIVEKRKLVEALKDRGTLILNRDDEKTMSFAGFGRQALLMTYGAEGGADINASNYEILTEKQGRRNVPCGISFKVNYKGSCIPVSLRGTLGFQHLYPVLAAFTVGISEEINLVAISEALSSYSTPPGRMKLVAGVKNTLIIDDTYNSSPVALAEALKVLGSIKNRSRKIAVLGDMLELGKYSVDEHSNAGKLAALNADVLFTVGVRGRGIAEGAINGGMSEQNIFQFDDSRECGKQVELFIKEGDIILVKGSQGVRMEKVVEEIMADPEKKKELLVRQEREWEWR
ncbi:MAG: UDP-N-acetylmuramoyl-tripeptide--D-alanyl-D-alanine ligase [Candidatus Paceibacterota bacterium]|jgi:UDP-N-acetylmuramoyl-tripeptide--D-alanyl-D-alanine ligase